jgi:hypothetical protein
MITAKQVTILTGSFDETNRLRRTSSNILIDLPPSQQ